MDRHVFSLKDHADLTLAMMKAGQSPLLADASAYNQSLIKTIISELGTNIIKYAKSGSITMERLEANGGVDIVIRARDSGPGIDNIDLAMEDRYSTGTSLGLGLPGVRRMADVFTIESSPSAGTVVSVQKKIKNSERVETSMDRLSNAVTKKEVFLDRALNLRNSLYDVAHYIRPMPSETISGDMAVHFVLPTGILMALIDVSGHGFEANKLANHMHDYLEQNANSNPIELMSDLHSQLRGTRGAAAGLLFVNTDSGIASYCGVGNTGVYRVKGEPWHPISKDGVLGQRLPTLREQKTTLANGDLIMMWTDGLSELAGKTFVKKNAHQSAASLARDLVAALGRPFDDAGCIIFKWVA